MIHLKSPDEIERLFEAGQLVKQVHDELEKLVAPGISTAELDAFAEALILKNKAQPAFKGYHGYPATLCVSINHEVVHGIPSPKRKIKDGDLVSIDLGVIIGGWFGDAARTHLAGNASADMKKLSDATRDSLMKAVTVMLPGNRLGDIGHAVQSTVEPLGYSVVRDFVGHGIGRAMHEDPQIPNYGQPGTGIRLKEGMVLAVEPMVNAGTWEVKVLRDGWTVVTRDQKPSAHWEHTVAITKDGPRVLT